MATRTTPDAASASGRAQRVTPAHIDELVTEEILTAEQRDQVLAAHEQAGKPLLSLVTELEFATEDALTPYVAKWNGFELVVLADSPPDIGVTSLLPESFIRRHMVIPLRIEEDVLWIAAVDPSNVVALDDVRIMTGRDIHVVMAKRSEILETLEYLAKYDKSESYLEQATEEQDSSEDTELVEAAPIVQAIHQIISQAVTQRASDIHIEPQEHDVRVRYRIDGVLHEVMRAQKGYQNGIVTRLKVMADMDIADRRKPADGRTTVKIEKEPIDLRVATMPSVWGEDVVLRILDRKARLLTLDDLGLTDDALARYQNAFTKPHGAVLVTGPTGSGKSTTLYATLNVLNSPDKKIITVEDPVEARLNGITQLQTNPRAGLTFATALKSILRADPDIIMVGEIRDRETANIAIEAPLTGHVMLSTLHTNDAPSAITRLVEMGVEPFLIASALECIVAQRLLRRLCPRCKEGYELDEEQMELLRIKPPADATGPVTVYRAIGCRYCARTGYRGRMSIVEVMSVSEEIEQLTVDRKSAKDIRHVAIDQGMRSLREDGMVKVLTGATSVAEVLRVVDGSAEGGDDKRPARKPARAPAAGTDGAAKPDGPRAVPDAPAEQREVAAPADERPAAAAAAATVVEPAAARAAGAETQPKRGARPAAAARRQAAPAPARVEQEDDGPETAVAASVPVKAPQAPETPPTAAVSAVARAKREPEPDGDDDWFGIDEDDDDARDEDDADSTAASADGDGLDYLEDLVTRRKPAADSPAQRPARASGASNGTGAPADDSSGRRAVRRG